MAEHTDNCRHIEKLNETAKLTVVLENPAWTVLGDGVETKLLGAAISRLEGRVAGRDYTMILHVSDHDQSLYTIASVRSIIRQTDIDSQLSGDMR